VLHQCAGVQTHRRQLLQLAGLTAVLGATQSAAPAHAASAHLLSPPRSKNYCCHTACKTAPQGALAAPVEEYQSRASQRWAACGAALETRHGCRLTLLSESHMSRGFEALAPNCWHIMLKPLGGVTRTAMGSHG